MIFSSSPLEEITLPLEVDHVTDERQDVIEYLEKEPVLNVLEIYDLKKERHRIDFYACRDGNEVQGHLMKITDPDGTYVSIAGRKEEVILELLKHLTDLKVVITCSPRFTQLISSQVRATAIYTNNIMLVRRGEEKLARLNPSSKLSAENALEYSEFFSPPLPTEWCKERLEKDSIFGIISDGKIVSIASAVAKMPKASVVMSVETRPEYRGRGYATLTTSAATEEALKHSEVAVLYVRSNNAQAIQIYEKLGYRKIGEEAWIDVGTGLVP